MEFLLDQGADVFAVDKSQRRSAIHYAVVNGHTDVLKLLLSDSAKVHTEDGQVPLRDVRIHDMSGQCRCALPLPRTVLASWLILLLQSPAQFKDCVIIHFEKPSHHLLSLLHSGLNCHC